MSTSVVYFAVHRTKPHGPIKIGFTSNLHVRKGNLSSAVPGGVTIIATVPGGKETEDFIHERFADARITGEWFEPTDDLRAFIQDVQNKKAGLIPLTDPGVYPRRRSPAEIAADCVAEAKEMLAFLLGREFRGPGDTIEAALHRLEMKTGIPSSIGFRIRHRPMNDMLVSNYFVVKEAYDAAVARSNAANSRAFAAASLLDRTAPEQDGDA